MCIISDWSWAKDTGGRTYALIAIASCDIVLLSPPRPPSSTHLLPPIEEIMPVDIMKTEERHIIETDTCVCVCHFPGVAIHYMQLCSWMKKSNSHMFVFLVLNFSSSLSLSISLSSKSDLTEYVNLELSAECFITDALVV